MGGELRQVMTLGIAYVYAKWLLNSKKIANL